MHRPYDGIGLTDTPDLVPSDPAQRDDGPMITYQGPATLTMPDEDGVTTAVVHVDLTTDPVTGEWRGTVTPDEPMHLTYEPVELTVPGSQPRPAVLMEGAGLEIYGEPPAPWSERG